MKIAAFVHIESDVYVVSKSHSVCLEIIMMSKYKLHSYIGLQCPG